MDAFAAHLRRAAAKVSTWPEWKQNILGGPAQRISATMEPDGYVAESDEEIDHIPRQLEDGDECCDEFYVEEEAREEPKPRPAIALKPPKLKDEHDIADVLFQYFLDKYPDQKITREPNVSGTIKHTWVIDCSKRQLAIRLNEDQLEFRTHGKTGDWISMDLNDPGVFNMINFFMHIAKTLV